MKKQNSHVQNSQKPSSVKMVTLKPLNSMKKAKSYIPRKVRSLKAVFNKAKLER